MRIKTKIRIIRDRIVHQRPVKPASFLVPNHIRQHARRETPIILRAGPRRHRHRVMPLQLYIHDPLRPCFIFNLPLLSSRLGRLPIAAIFFRDLYDLIEVQFPRRRENGISRPISPPKIFRHLVPLQRRNRLGRSQHASPQRMPREVRLHQRFINTMPRIVEIHRDLFQDHLFLGIKIFLTNRGPQQKRKMLNRPLRKLRQHIREISRILLARIRVIVRTHFVKDAVDIFPRIFARTLEHHVLKEMGNPVDLRGFIPAARIDIKPSRKRMRIRIRLGDNLKAVGKSSVMKSHVICHWSLVICGTGTDRF